MTLLSLLLKLYSLYRRSWLSLVRPGNKFITKMRRYSRQEETPFAASYADLKAKQLTGSRLLASPALARNPETDLSRLPALLPSARRPSSLASDRNAKFRLQNLE